MKVVLGLDLEGCTLPESHRGLNRLAAGPRTFLDLLEVRLGLPAAQVDETSRLLSFRQAMADAGRQLSRFYTRSFALDSLGSAKVLLRWRDELSLAGWRGEVGDSDAPARLRDLAAVEAIFAGDPGRSPDEPSRLNAVRDALRAGRNHGIDRVDLVDAIEDFPGRWREVLEALPIFPRAFSPPDRPLAKPGSRLHFLQQRLLGLEEAPPATGPDDDSVQIVEGPVLARLADAAANHLRDLAGASAPATCLIADPAATGTLNRALADLDLPTAGLRTESQSGSLPQLVPLVLNLHWGPFNPQAWLEFFLHPISPVSPLLARRMAETVQSRPSREHPRWEETIAECRAAAADSEASRRLAGQVEDWLKPTEFRGDADTEVLAETARKLGRWMGRRASSRTAAPGQGSLWRGTSAAVSRLAVTLESAERISREDFDRVIGEWLGTCAVGASEEGEAGGPFSLRTPAHLLEACDRVLWWQPRETDGGGRPWYPDEISWLADRGIHLSDPDLERVRLQEATLRPLLLARESVILFAGRGDRNSEGGAPSPITRLLAECGDGIRRLPESMIATETCEVRRLQPLGPDWTVRTPELLSPRDRESFSSLHHFIYSPWQWVLQYRAGLRPGRVCEFRIVDDARRQGSLLHGFVESLLETPPDPVELIDTNIPVGGGKIAEGDSVGPGLLGTLVKRLFDEERASIDWKEVSRERVERWVEGHWDEILRIEAAHYLVPGHEASRSELLYLAKSGLWELIDQFRAAGIVSVTCEDEIEIDSPLGGGKLSGFIDLRVTNAAGQTGLIDMKLGGHSSRLEELAKGRHLQLATYGCLVRESCAEVAHCAYFVFSGGGHLLARSQRFFPRAEVPSGSDSPSDDWESCWAEFEEIWRERRDQLNRGEIEVTHSALRQPFQPEHWKIPTPEQYSRFLNLAGWESTQ